MGVSDATSERATHSRIGHRTWLVLGVILACCFATRIGWVLHLEATDPGRTWSSDTWSYLRPAEFLAHAGHFPATMFVRTPGYPTLLGAVFAIHDSETAFLVVQVGLSCATVLACFLIASRLWGPTTGLVAAGITVLEPLQFVASGRLLTESVSSLALIAVVGAGFRVFGGRDGSTSPLWAGLLGVALAIAALIRPTVYYLPLFALVLLAARALRRPTRRRELVLAAAALLLPVVVAFGTWQWRNHQEVDSWRFSGIEAKNMAGYRAAGVIAWRDGVDLQTARDRVDRDIDHPPHSARALGPFYEELFEKGTSVVLDDPVALAAITAKGLAAGAFGPGTKYVGNYFGLPASRLLAGALLAWLVAVYAAAAIGIVNVLRHDRERLLGHLFAWGTVVYVLLASAGPESNARFRAPLMPIVALYAAYGAVAVGRSRVARRDERRLASRSL